MSETLLYIGNVALTMTATARIICNGEKIKCEQRYVLVKSNQVQSPFNWMNYIVMPDDLQESDVTLKK